MAIPSTVQRQLEAAEAQAAAQIAPQPPTNMVTDVAQFAQPAQPPVVAPAPVAPAQPTEDWQQKYRSLQGMYQAEMPSLRAKEKTLESEVTALREQVRVLTLAAQQPQKTEPKEHDPRDVDAFGKDMIDMVQRYAEQTIGTVRHDVQAALSTLVDRVSALEQNVSGVAQKAETTLEAQFYAALTATVPDWKEINSSQEWLAWLAVVDDVYGAPRQAALDAAHKRADVERVAAVFNQFKKSRPANPSEALASQLSPSMNAAGIAPAPQQAQAQTLSRKAVEQFYQDVARRKYVGRETEAEAIEAQINAAAVAGLIV